MWWCEVQLILLTRKQTVYEQFSPVLAHPKLQVHPIVGDGLQAGQCLYRKTQRGQVEYLRGLVIDHESGIGNVVNNFKTVKDQRFQLVGVVDDDRRKPPYLGCKSVKRRVLLRLIPS